MFGLPIRSVMEPRKLVVASPQTSVREAARLMMEARVGAVLVVSEGRLVGIFTERDVVYRITAVDRDPRATRLGEVMTPQPKTLAPEESFGRALLVMHENGFRHVPVVEDGKPLGMISARDALEPELRDFETELLHREHLGEMIR